MLADRPERGVTRKAVLVDDRGQLIGLVIREVHLPTVEDIAARIQANGLSDAIPDQITAFG